MSTTIETITVTRPMKVIAYTLCFISVFLLIGAVSSSSWVDSHHWREGLFAQCVEKGAPLPLPLGLDITEEGCSKVRSAGYIKGTAALMIIAIMVDMFGTLLTGLGLRSTDPNKKYKYYRVAIYALIVATIALLLVVIIYPVSFSKDLDKEGGNPPLNGYIAVAPSTVDIDLDDDGIPDAFDTDDDNDGIPDALDQDDDNDGIMDNEDNDDDNDGIPDDQDADVDVEDSDGDGVKDIDDNDDDNDGIPDALDNDDDGDGTPDIIDDPEGLLEGDLVEKDTDGDGTVDSLDDDIDNDGIKNINDEDDDGDGIEDVEDFKVGQMRVYSYGFGYGATWLCLIFIFLSVVLLICDRESEEIFYKERPVEGEEEEEEA
jgi:hypothetical protein